MEIRFKISLRIFVVVLLLWGGLTLWVERERTAPVEVLAAPSAAGRALVLYNPDPIYDLDRQVGTAFASALNDQGWEVTLASHGEISAGYDPGFDLYVFIANTYNWAPDWPTRRTIRKATWLAGRPVVAITLGSGSTSRSQRLLLASLQDRGAQVLASETNWLFRPNDASRVEISNVQVALEMAERLGLKTAAAMKRVNGNQ